jgi:hypothetical protein
MFDLAIDSKLRGCDIVKIVIGDLVSGRRAGSRAIVVQRKTGRTVQFELPNLPTQAGIGLRRENCGTHSLRRTKASIIYMQTGNPEPFRSSFGIQR